MLVAKDFMTSRPMTFYSSASLESALLGFGDYRVSSAAVISPAGEIIGILTENVLLKLYLANASKNAASEKLVTFKKHFVKADCIHELESIEKVLKIIKTSESGRLWVVDGRECLVGVISPKDIFQLLRGEERSAEPMRDELKKLKSDLKIASSQAKRTSERLNRLETIINGSSYMLHSIDKNGAIILANRRIHQVLEYNYGEMIGLTLEDLYGPDIAKVARQSLNRIASGKDQDVIRTSFKRKTGGFVRVEIITASVKDRDGNFVATSSMSRLMDSEVKK